MSDKCSFRKALKEGLVAMDRRDAVAQRVQISPPKSAYDLLMEKHKRDKTVWFTDEKCPLCGKDIYTDGKTKWCGERCNPFGTYAALQEDYIR